jgi:hypothetical protein
MDFQGGNEMLSIESNSQGSQDETKCLVGMIVVLFLPGLLLALSNGDWLFFVLVMADSLAGVGLGVWLATHRRAGISKVGFIPYDSPKRRSVKDVAKRKKKDELGDEKKAA